MDLYKNLLGSRDDYKWLDIYLVELPMCSLVVYFPPRFFSIWLIPRDTLFDLYIFIPTILFFGMVK